MKNSITGCLDPSFAEGREDLDWFSESCKQKVRECVFKRYPCRQKFIKVDVSPLYACGTQRHYRVNLWVNDWSSGTLGPVPEMWKTIYVTLEGAKRTVVSIEEGKRKRLAIGENGQKLIDELGILQEPKV